MELLERAVELQRIFQTNLIDLLRTELDLIETFQQIAQTTKDNGHRKAVLDKANIAVDAIRHYEVRIEDRYIASQIRHRAEELKIVSSAIKDSGFPETP